MIFRKTFGKALLAVAFSYCALTASAQNSYVKVGSTYNMGLGSSVAAYKTSGTVRQDNTASVTVTQQKVNLASGWLFQVAGGHFFTENLGAELAFGYLPGKAHKTESKLYYSGIGVTEGLDKTYDARLLLLQPALVVRMNPQTITPYGRFGLILAKADLKETVKNSFWTNSLEVVHEYSGGMGFGFQGGFGVDFVANSQITLFSEITLNSLSWAPKKREMVAYLEDGASKLDNIPAGDRETLYTDKFTLSYDKKGELIKTNGPTHDIKGILPMNTVGLGLGLKYTF